MSAAALDAAPDYIEPLEAWRVWRVVECDGELWLASVVKRTLWRAGEPLAAECLRRRTLRSWLRRRPRHVAPHCDCECGIYATELTRAGEYLNDSFPEALGRVFGRVSLWGTVVECERGFRASHAYPLALYVAADAAPGQRATPQTIAAGLARYGVPVEVLPHMRRQAPRLLRAAG